jgi:hypothetical protein
MQTIRREIAQLFMSQGFPQLKTCCNMSFEKLILSHKFQFCPYNYPEKIHEHEVPGRSNCILSFHNIILVGKKRERREKKKKKLVSMDTEAKKTIP